ncbi:MAG: c-type cytochrome [Saprospiraceae bacterium]
MKTFKLSVILFVFLSVFTSCGGNKSNQSSKTAPGVGATTTSSTEDYDPKRGEGKYTSENLILDGTLNSSMADVGEKISGVKCTSCHKITEEKLVGPGWKGVTQRRTPHWILNFITNPDPMIDKDPELQAQLELCLVRMPNQSLSEDDARNVLEFMRKNDGVK